MLGLSPLNYSKLFFFSRVYFLGRRDVIIYDLDLLAWCPNCTVIHLLQKFEHECPILRKPNFAIQYKIYSLGTKEKGGKLLS